MKNLVQNACLGLCMAVIFCIKEAGAFAIRAYEWCEKINNQRKEKLKKAGA